MTTSPETGQSLNLVKPDQLFIEKFTMFNNEESDRGLIPSSAGLVNSAC